ncbi:MAG: ATP-dependent helicase, partial [Acidobacteriota bacterium]|nr:ATP-dependent helicase [Acidobacteriota bacterium]
WGGRVNKPWVTALAEAWERRHAYPLECDSENDCVIVTVPDDLEVAELFELVRPDNLEELLRGRLESTGFFGAGFRENAGRALLLPRSDLKRRVPLWLQRERAKKLFETVASYEDFPIVVETWRSCLRDGFDLDSLRQVLREVEAGEIVLEEATTTSATPFAGNLVWKQTNRLMYEGGASESGPSAVRGDLLKELVFSSELRPRIPAELLQEFEAKLQRLWFGYAPRTAADLVDWAIERIWLPANEWDDLVAAIARQAEKEGEPVDLEELVAEASWRIVGVGLGPDRSGASEKGVCALETLPRLLRSLDRGLEDVRVFSPDSGDSSPELRDRVERAMDVMMAATEPARSGEDELSLLLGEWSRFYGPFQPEHLERSFCLSPEEVSRQMAQLADEQTLVVDRFREPTRAGDEAPLEICEAENLERLLRLLRVRNRPVFRPLSLAQLPLFFALHQGLADRRDGIDGLQKTLDHLFGFPAPARLWETDLFTARLDPYYPAWLDSLLLESDLRWSGCGREKTTFVFPDEIELLSDSSDPMPEDEKAPVSGHEELFPDHQGRFGFEELLKSSGVESAELTRRLWDGVWEGQVSNTGYQALRRGLMTRFEPFESEQQEAVAGRRTPRGGRARFERWRTSRPFSGDWYLLWADGEKGENTLDAIDLEEINRDRVRLLLDRYGVLFRELLSRELPSMAWSRLFRTLRIMELSGEVLAGHFFRGIPGPQFASRAAFRCLNAGLPEDVIFWMSAADPASPSGLALEELRGDPSLKPPARRASSHLVFHGSRRVVVSKRGGGEIEIAVAPDHPSLAEYLGFLKVPLTRQFAPVKAIDIERINGESATQSPYEPVLRELFAVTRERKVLRLRRRY